MLHHSHYEVQVHHKKLNEWHLHNNKDIFDTLEDANAQMDELYGHTEWINYDMVRVVQVFRTTLEERKLTHINPKPKKFTYLFQHGKRFYTVETEESYEKATTMALGLVEGSCEAEWELIRIVERE